MFINTIIIKLNNNKDLNWEKQGSCICAKDKLFVKKVIYNHITPIHKVK